MASLAMSEINLLKVWKTGKILRTMVHLKKKILPQFFAEYPMEVDKEKH